MAEIAGYCTLCRSRCGTLNRIEDGRLIAVEPLAGHPTGGAVCAKGRAAPELVHSPHRLTRPLRRTRPKGSPDPGWQPISWDAAMGEIAARLGAIRAEHGAEAVGFAVTTTSATAMIDSGEWVERFVRLFGSPNLCNATEVCNWQKDTGQGFTWGAPLPLPDYRNTDLVVLWGHNPSSVWLAEAGELAAAVARGAKLAVIDPRRTGHAHQADHWLGLRPGTDAALALGLAHLLISTGRYDAGFVRAWTNGPLLVRADTGRFLRLRDIDPAAGDGFVAYDGLAGQAVPYDPRRDPAGWTDRLDLFGSHTVGGIACRPAFALYAERCAAFPPERAAAVTGLDPGQITALADTIAAAGAVSYYVWTGVGRHAGSSQIARAIATLHALTGSFDAPGGNVVPALHPANPIADAALFTPAQRARALGVAERPLGPAALGFVTARELYTAILEAKPYRMRALVTFGANLLLSRADPDLGRRALQALDFAVHCDLFDNPTAREADILLPVGSAWEREGLKLGFDVTQEAQELIQLRPAMLPRLGECRSDAEIVCDLAVRLGFGADMFGGDIEAGWRHRLAPLGLTPDDLRAARQGIRVPLATRHRKHAEPVAGGVRGFATETGRAEIYSELLLRHGEDPLPAAVMPATDADHPFLLSCAKSPHYCHSQHRQAASLRRRSPEPRVMLAPAIAAARGIADGDWVEIATRSGRARFRAGIDAALAPDVALAEFGWWRATPELGLPGYDPARDAGSNFNRLIDGAAADPLSGAPAHKSTPCDIRRLALQPRQGWTGRRRLTVTARHEEPGGAVALTLAAADGAPLPSCLPGQHVTLALGDGRPERSYSLCGPPDAPYRVAVRPLAGGAVSPACAALAPGDTVEARAPAGDFLLPLQADFPVVLIAAGIGITPFLGYLQALAAAPSAPEVVLHYGSRNRAHHAFAAEIAGLAARLPSLTVANHYSRPDPGDQIGRIDAATIDQALIDRRARFYLCGPAAMIDGLRRGLVRRGVPAFEIFAEIFRSPPAPALGTARHAVTFARSGRTAVWSPEQGSLLAFSEALGLRLPAGCRVGQCESCALPVVSGAVTHLTAVGHAEDGSCLSCLAVPASDLVLDA